MNSEDLPPLPPTLEEEIRALRQVNPPQSLVERTFAGLPERAAAERRGRVDVPAKPNPGIGSAFVRALPVMVVVAAVAHAIWGHITRAPEVVRVEERALALPEAGHAWTELHLQTHHHDDLPALVHLEVPTHVRVQLPSENNQRSCAEARCVHKFTHHHGKPLRVAVTHPGRYEIHVRHESKKAALREQFVLTASRDDQEAPPNRAD